MFDSPILKAMKESYIRHSSAEPEVKKFMPVWNVASVGAIVPELGYDFFRTYLAFSSFTRRTFSFGLPKFYDFVNSNIGQPACQRMKEYKFIKIVADKAGFLESGLIGY